MSRTTTSRNPQRLVALTPLDKPVCLTIPDSDVTLIAVGLLQDAVIVEVVEDSKRIATMSLEQYITNDPQIMLDLIPDILAKLPRATERTPHPMTREERHRGLDELVALSEEMGLYDEENAAIRK